MSTRKYNAISSFEMKGSNRDHSGQSIDEYQFEILFPPFLVGVVWCKVKAFYYLLKTPL